MIGFFLNLFCRFKSLKKKSVKFTQGKCHTNDTPLCLDYYCINIPNDNLSIKGKMSELLNSSKSSNSSSSCSFNGNATFITKWVIYFEFITSIWLQLFMFILSKSEWITNLINSISRYRLRGIKIADLLKWRSLAIEKQLNWQD